MKTGNIRFEAKVAIGIHGSVAVMMLTESWIPPDGFSMRDGIGQPHEIRDDVMAKGAVYWSQCLREYAPEIGVHHIKGEAMADAESGDVEYLRVKWMQVRQ